MCTQRARWHAAQGFVNAGTTSARVQRNPVVGWTAASAVDLESRPAQAVADVAPDEISQDAPLRVLIAGGGVGGLALANALSSHPHVTVTVLEKTQKFMRFGGPIQLASNAMMNLRNMDAELYRQIEAKATFTGNLTNGIKDGIRNEWYAMFDLKSPAQERNMPFTCVV